MAIIVSCTFCGAPVYRKPSALRLNRSGKCYCSHACRGKDHARQSVAQFWTHVNRCSHGETCQVCCWLWRTSRDTWGYGQVVIRHDGRQRKYGAHRFSWLLTRGDIPEGLMVLHNCPGGDNKACVNPQHLWLGTHKDNVHDALQKGQTPRGDRHGARRHPETHARGETHPLARLTEDIVRYARQLHSNGWTYSRIARSLHLPTMTIADAIQRRTWKHID